MKTKIVLLAGQPNVGKSTLFNALTGAKQRVANYPGATVEKKFGECTTPNGTPLMIVDLPGTYSLNAKTEDERIAVDCILGQQKDVGKADFVLVVGEAFHLDRSLFLFEQIRLLHPHAILVLNMIDELKASGKTIDIQKLAHILNAPVFAIAAAQNVGLTSLFEYLESNPQNLPSQSEPTPLTDVTSLFQKIDKIVAAVVQTPDTASKQKHSTTTQLDKWLLHPVFGSLCFLVVLAVVFQALFSWSSPLMDAVESGVAILENIASAHLTNGMFKSLIIDGVLGGVGSVVVFVPQIAIAFLLIGVLEASGYLSRGAFLIDRLMRVFGLEGRSFIPLISSFACALPGIMATRSIANPRQRLITILVAPLMTCSARLPVYTLLIGTFIPAKTVFGFFTLQGLTLMGLFLLGIIAMMLVSMAFNLLLPKSPNSPTFVMELPRYRWPRPRTLYLYVSTKVIGFLKSAGSIIFVLCLLLWAMAYFPHSASISQKYEQERQTLKQSVVDAVNFDLPNELAKIDNAEAGEFLRTSFMGQLGIALEPIFKPMGADWRLGIGIISSFAAREVFVSTLGVVFNLGDANEESEGLRAILTNSKKADGQPVYSFATAMAVLVFFALAAQCLSTLAVIKRETNSIKWALVSFGYMSVLAYTAAVLTFQLLNTFA